MLSECKFNMQWFLSYFEVLNFKKRYPLADKTGKIEINLVEIFI